MNSLLQLPSPLHPAIVHFPIVLVLLGTALAVFSLFSKRKDLSLSVAVVLCLGALGSLLAGKTGERDSERVAETPALEQVMEAHEEWAERSQVAACLVAGLAVAAVFCGKWPALKQTLKIAIVATGAAACFCVVETGHYGGLLVYQHGAGVTLNSASGAPTAQQADAPHGNRNKDDDD